MKKIIKNKVYDTDTARELCTFEPNSSKKDKSWYKEVLYQKKTGEYFLHGQGNSESIYSKALSKKEKKGIEKLIPMNYDEAAAWAKKNLSTEIYDKIFGVPEEDSERIIISISIRKDTHMKLKRAAAQAGKTVSEYIEDMI